MSEKRVMTGLTEIANKNENTWLLLVKITLNVTSSTKHLVATSNSLLARNRSLMLRVIFLSKTQLLGQNRTGYERRRDLHWSH